MLMREIQDLNKWREILCSEFGILNIVRMSVLLEVMHRLNVIPIKIPARCFLGNIGKIIQKFVWQKPTRLWENLFFFKSPRTCWTTFPFSFFCCFLVVYKTFRGDGLWPRVYHAPRMPTFWINLLFFPNKQKRMEIQRNQNR